MSLILRICLFLVGVLHLFPVIGVLGVQRLSALYGVDVSGPDLLLLMRHRAVLFGIVGGFMLWSAFTATLYDVATVIGIVSMLSFIALAMSAPTLNSQLRHVVYIDALAVMILAMAWLLDRCAR